MLDGFLLKLRGGQSLSVEESRAAFDVIFTGKVSDAVLGEFLLRLHKKGETVDEIRGAVVSMREKALTIEAPAHAIDIVGTGGDARGTYNISTAVAFVVAACGVPVAKHGNRAATSKSGSSDVLVALGVNLEPSLPLLERCLDEAGLCFMFAPRHHPAIRSVAAVRKKLGVRTIFNLLGPMTNPANVKRHLIGVYAKEWLRPITEVLQTLGSQAAWVARGHDGMDEISTIAASDVVTLKDGAIAELTVLPENVGIVPPILAQLQGGDADYNAVAIHRLLLGEKSAYRDAVLLNASAALVISGKVADLQEGLVLAGDSLDSGAARGTLEKVIEVTNRAFA
ncbi:MAG: anthranilate phosphoribosyltransferase [Alphaproteobacteria bacterium]